MRFEVKSLGFPDEFPAGHASWRLPEDLFEERAPSKRIQKAPVQTVFPASTTFFVDSTIKIVDGCGMARKPAVKPTPAEVEILGILWDRGPSTVREVHERLGADRSVGYTGALKLLQNMHAKRLVHRNQDGQAHVYEAREPARMKRQLLGDLMQRVFAGSASQLVLHLLENEKATPQEIEEIRQMLAKHQRRSK